MPRRPPVNCPGPGPIMVDIPANVVLVRVHSRRFRPIEPNFTPSTSPKKGGRFDSTLGDYGYLYFAEDDCTAIDEALLRDRKFNMQRLRSMRRRELIDRDISEVFVLRSLPVV